MTLIELKSGLNQLLQRQFPKPKYKYYSMAVIEGYDRPCFFTQIRPVDISPANYNTRHCQVMFYITYLQEQANETEILDFIQIMENLFGLAVQIGTQSVNVLDFGWNYVGTDRNIPEIAVELEWMDKIEHQHDAPLVEQIMIKNEMEG